MYQNTRSCPQLPATFSSSKSVFLGVFYFGQFVVVPSSSSSSLLERLTFQRSAFRTAFRFHERCPGSHASPRTLPNTQTHGPPSLHRVLPGALPCGRSRPGLAGLAALASPGFEWGLLGENPPCTTCDSRPGQLQDWPGHCPSRALCSVSGVTVPRVLLVSWFQAGG